MIEFDKVIRDPVHGYIGLTKEELKILSLPILQRLRWITQLSFVDLVYPDAKHSRLSHSLGVMHLCWKYAEHLKTLGIVKDDEEIRLLRLVGLLHDVGHCPFSHAFEPAFYKFIFKEGNDWHDVHIRHGQKIITNEFYGISSIIGNEGTQLISKLINGEAESVGKPPIYNYIIKGLFCADRIDYLQRDAYHIGTPEYAIIDSDRIIRSFRIHDNSVRYSKKGLYALEGAVLSYYYLYRAAYYHHTTRAAYSMFTELTWQILSDKDKLEKLKIYFEPERFIYFTDFQFIGNEEVKNHPLTIALLHRKIPKTILAETDFKTYSGVLEKLFALVQKDFELKRNIEGIIRNKMNAQLILIDTPSFIPYLPPESAEPHVILDEKDPLKTEFLTDRSPLLKALKAEQKKRVPRVYIDRECLPKNENELPSFKKKLIDEIWISLSEIEKKGGCK